MTQIRGQRKQEGTSSSFGLHSPVFVMFMYNNNNNNTLKAQSLDYPYSSSLGSWVTKSRRTGLCCITVWHIRDSQMLKISKYFQDFRGHCDWSQLSVSVTWILLPDGKGNLFKLPQRDLARQWAHSTKKERKKEKTTMTTRIIFGKYRGKLCRSHHRQKKHIYKGWTRSMYTAVEHDQ